MKPSEKLLGQLITYAIFISDECSNMTVSELKEWLSQVFPRETIEKVFDDLSMDDDSKFSERIGEYYE